MKSKLSIVRIIISVAIVVLALLQLLNVWENAAYVYIPLMGIMMVIQGIQEWKRSRGLAIFSLCTAAFMFVCTFVVYFVKG